NMGLSCGNPTATANLRDGEVVVDLGSGGGLDVFLAAQKVGPTGRAIGIDMTPDMIELARRNAEKRIRDGADGNVEFHLSTIDDIPVEDASADCVISNCVINLAPDKSKVFREMARILKPGGRVAISDIALKQPLPPEIAADVTAYVGCIAGAISIDEYRDGLLAAGFEHVEILDSGADLNAYGLADTGQSCCAPAPEAAVASTSSVDVVQISKPAGRSLPVSGSYECCSPEPAHDVLSGLAELLAKANVNEYAASVRVFAVKPA
ncbi:MAG: methyltransferase domain-containing protein, partial [Blastocatellia bacterium]|nr:methyltransferase domain-containing protein [Blastocatellia bacterium]